MDEETLFHRLAELKQRGCEITIKKDLIDVEVPFWEYEYVVHSSDDKIVFSARVQSDCLPTRILPDWVPTQPLVMEVIDNSHLLE